MGPRRDNIRYTGPELEQIFDEYFASCQEQGKRPTAEGFAGKLGISSTTLRHWLSGENIKSNSQNDKWAVVQDSLKKCMDKITDSLQQNKDSMSIFLLKQVQYGGFIDKIQQEQSGGVEITVKGSGGIKWGK